MTMVDIWQENQPKQFVYLCCMIQSPRMGTHTMENWRAGEQVTQGLADSTSIPLYIIFVATSSCPSAISN